MKVTIKSWGRWIIRLFLAALVLFMLTYLLRKQLYPLFLEAIYEDSVPSIETHRMPPTAVLLDTRSREEFQVSHLPHARWVGFEEFELTEVAQLPKDTPIVLYCSIGYRSERIGEQLKAAGYQEVYNLYGGIFEWMNKGQPVIDSTGQTIERLHGYSPIWGFWAREGEVVYE